MNDVVNVAFIGNPNCGKTTLFNAYTGAKLKVANWPGVTVEKKEGMMKYHNHRYKVVDLPGIYALTSYTMEEKLSRTYILEDEVDVIVDVADASCLERNLYLALQLIELGKPVVLALNMMDIVEERGMEIDLHRLPEMLGIPVIPVCARKKTGLNILMHAVAHHRNHPIDYLEHHHEEGNHIHKHHNEYVMVYSDALEDKIDRLQELCLNRYPDMVNPRWHAIKMLEWDEEILQKYPFEGRDEILDQNYEQEIIRQKYDFIEEIIDEVLVNKDVKSRKTDAIDQILTNRYLGIPSFLIIMAIVFALTFFVGDWMKGYLEIVLEWISVALEQVLVSIHVGKTLTSLVMDGLYAGVGGILTFLPNIAILFLALAFLEDSGYMSRVAYVMDGLMAKMGLSGRAFIPMLLGFGCSVPAIMASRTLENKKDRIKTILITPFMSCSARLPVYVILSQMFFGRYAMLAAYAMYVIGIVVAVLMAVFISLIQKTVKTENTLLIELPEYKVPNARSIAIYVWEKVRDYITKAGTTIFLASFVIWLVMNFGPHGLTNDISQSFAAILGRMLIPIMKPAGLGYWQVIVSLIAGIAGKEVVVSSMGVLFGISNVASETGMTSLAGMLREIGFNTANAWAMMVFCLLYIPCAATIAVIRKETESNRYALIAIGMQLLVAWGCSTFFYKILTYFFIA